MRGNPLPKKKNSNAFQQFCGTKKFCLIFKMGDGEYFKKAGLKRKQKGVEKKQKGGCNRQRKYEVINNNN